ncbi:MAG: terminase family protein [Bacteroidota bacterium]|nr:terminase family protein [Bacteroidota bacterium]
MKKLTLLQEALIEEKKLAFDAKQKLLKRKIKPTDILSVLLPNYKPQPKQCLFHNSSAYEKGIKGGFQSGKTTAFCAEAIYLGYLNRPHPVLLVSPGYDGAISILGEKLKEFCEDNNLEYEFLTSRGEFNISFGHKPGDQIRIWLAGGESPQFLKGYTVAAAGMDEPFVQSKETFEVVLSRISKKSVRNAFFWSGTPEPNKMEWGLNYFERDHNEKTLFTVTIPTHDNIHLTKTYIEKLESKYDSRTQEVYLKGKYLLLSANRVYYAFKKQKNTFSLEHKCVSGELILSFDFNVDPMTAVVIAVDKSKSVPVAYQLKEFSLSSSNTKELCVAVIAWIESSHNSKLKNKNTIIITGDATGKKRGTRSYFSDYEIIRDEFAKAGINFYFNVPNENPPVRDRVNFVNKLFEQNLFYISENCLKSIRDRELVTWKQSGEGFIIDKSKKDLTHLSDAADYGLYNNQIVLSPDSEETGFYLEYRHR